MPWQVAFAAPVSALRSLIGFRAVTGSVRGWCRGMWLYWGRWLVLQVME